MRGSGSKLLIIILIGLLAYNIWQISVLRNEVSDLKAEVIALRKAASSGESDKSGVYAIIDNARGHLEKAKDLVFEGNLKNAGKELQKSLRILEDAGKEVKDPSVNALQSMQKKLKDTTAGIEKFWHKIDGENDSPKGDKVQ
ncbi:MAG: hypothetical protein ACYC27_06885 [Armatimonadota bacterium]